MGSELAADRQKNTLSAFGRTSVGRLREHNEDSFVLADLSLRRRVDSEGLERASLGPSGALFAVCDGMGGAAAGEVASKLAAEHLYESLIESTEPPPGLEDVARRLVSAVEVANERVLERAGSSLSLSGMGTTMTAAWVVDHHLVIAQVGDSRAYVLRRGELTQVTEDQSLVNHLLALGELAIEDVPTFKYSSVILQALGTSPGVYVALSTVDLVDGDRVLICSDGLSGMLSSGAIASVLGSGDTPEQMASALIKRANAAGGHDNITAIVIHFFGDTSSAEVSEFPRVRYRAYELVGYTTERPWDGLSIHSLLGGEQPRASTTAARRRAQRSSKGREGAKEHDVNASASSVWRAASTWLLLMGIFVVAWFIWRTR